jgi:hypothetical protein
MPVDTRTLGQQLAADMLASLRTDSGKVKALAVAEAEALAHALDRIAGLMAGGQIDASEAQVLIRIQMDASEAVLASLAEVGRLSAQRALGQALTGAARLVDAVIGVPLAAVVLQLARAGERAGAANAPDGAFPNRL